MDFRSAFTFAFQDPDWLKKVGLAAVIFLIPLLGPIIVLGWGLEITRRVINDESELLPGWENFSNYIPKGFQAMVVNLAYALPAILILICGQLVNVGIVTAMSNSNSNTLGSVATIVSLCMSCFVFILLIAASFMIPAAHGSLASSGELGSAFRFNEILGLVRAAPGPFIMVIVGVGLANLILAPIGSLICGIGVLAATAYTTTLSSNLTGQAYKAAKAAQQSAG